MARPKLPPLTALRAFEAAARLESFSRAADEIHVTHGAVSHQVKGLEDFLGVRLFTRGGRGVTTTLAGKQFAERVGFALDHIAQASSGIARREHANRLTISAVPSFAARWLMPRIGTFMEAHPELDVNVHTSKQLVDFSRDDVDVAIRFGRGPWPNVHAELLMGDEYFPVCSPRLKHGRLPRRPQDLPGFRLLRSDNEPWTPWFRAAAVDAPEPTKGPVIDDSSMLLQAAAAGQGIALARRSLVANELAAGTLVRLFDIGWPAANAHYLVWPEQSEPAPKILAFRRWLKREVRRDRLRL